MIALMILLLTGVASADRPRRGEEPPTPPERPLVEPIAMMDVQVEPGSLWSEAEGHRLLGLDTVARQIGDLVTVRVTESTTTNLDASTSTSRDSQADAGISAMMGAESGVIANNPGMGGAIRVGGSSSNAFSGSGSTSRGTQVDSMITCEILEILPSGVLHLWGYKQVRVNREIQYVVVEGFVRPRDILLDNTVRSDLLANARIEVTGTGVVADKQGPGWFVRVLDALWPF